MGPGKRKGEGVATPWIPQEEGWVKTHQHVAFLILFVEASVKSIFRLGRDFSWPKPKACPRCQGRLWGHGFVEAYFDGFDAPLLLRRYRCPECRSVIRLRPKGYWPRFQASVGTIRRCLVSRLKLLKWRPDLPRSRQRHWLRGLRRQIVIHLGASWTGDLLEAFDQLASQGIIAVSRTA